MRGQHLLDRRASASRLALVALAAVTGAGALSSCGTSGIGPAPLQRSISQTFAGRYVLQQAAQGHPAPAVASLQPLAACSRGTPEQQQSGAGSDWTCRVTFFVAGPATPVTALYTVDVRTDGCYSADGDGPASVNGSRTLTGAGYRQVLNPLWRLEGCFDVTRS